MMNALSAAGLPLNEDVGGGVGDGVPGDDPDPDRLGWDARDGLVRCVPQRVLPVRVPP